MNEYIKGFLIGLGLMGGVWLAKNGLMEVGLSVSCIALTIIIFTIVKN